MISMDETGRPDYLGTGIPDLGAAKRYLRRKWNQGLPEKIVSRPGARFYVTAKCGGHAYALLGPYVSHMTALAAVPRAQRLLAAAQAGELARLRPFTALGTSSAPVTMPTVFGR